MSRLESNSEPSMEEILASIRKIIAEDSSGLRTSATPPRPGMPYSPAPRSAVPQPSAAPAQTPQRGFMSREAFLKSSPVEPEAPKESYAPLGTSRSASESPAFQPATRPRPRADVSPAGAILGKEPPQPLKPEISKPEAFAPSRPSISRDDTLSIDAQIAAATSLTIETVEVVSVEDVLPIVRDDAPAVLKVESETVAKPGGKSDVASIEAQLSELLSEDLNALRESRAKAQAEEAAARAETPANEPSETSEEIAVQTESNDPFAFDLGPSPFAPKSEPQRKAETQNTASPVSATPAVAAEPAPVEKSEPPRASATPTSELESNFEPAVPTPAKPQVSAAEISDAAPQSAEPNVPINAMPDFGSFVPGGAFAANTTSASGSTPPRADTVSPASAAPAASVPPPKFEPEAPTPRPRQTFAVPSVSATLGPSRKLEPLSNAFRPAPPPPPNVLETFVPASESVPEPRKPEVRTPEARASEPPQAPEPPWLVIPSRTPDQARAAEPPSQSQPQPSQPQRDETVLHSTLPATTSDSALDRHIEDAVADLLRPLLKTWLAENMPKIVERALRREMTERLLPGQKNPRD